MMNLKSLLFAPVILLMSNCTTQSQAQTSESGNNTITIGINKTAKIPNSKINLEFKNIVLSEGKWCRNTNELELKDINLRCSFYLLIDNKKLVSKLFLGDYKSFLLIYK